MTFSQGIETLRKEGFSDDEIIDNIRKLRPNLDGGINTLKKEGFSSDEIVQNLSSIQFGEKKLNKTESIQAGLIEGVFGIPAIAGMVGSKLAPTQGEDMFLERNIPADIMQRSEGRNPSFTEMFALSDDDILPPSFSNPKKSEQATGSQEALDPVFSLLQGLPESETQAGRRLRTGVAALPVSLAFGIPGLVGGVVGSQLGQTVRETFGKDGKSEGVGTEIGAILADIIGGGGAAIATDLARNSRQASRLPSLFDEGANFLERKSIKNIVQGDESALNDTIRNQSTNTIRAFENTIANQAPETIQEIGAPSIRNLQETADNAYRSQILRTLSPAESTIEEGGRALQNTANRLFQTTVVDAERNAYNSVRQLATGLQGSAPTALSAAETLLERLTTTAPSPEQAPMINWLRSFVNDLQPRAQANPILDQFGRPVQQARRAAQLPANDLIEMLQKANSLAYSSEMRGQINRIRPILNTFRQEINSILAQRPDAQNAYMAANNLHAQNSNVWGTRYMNQVRFSENPENIISNGSKASNMRNFRQAIRDPNSQNLFERLVIDNVTRSGSASSNRNAIAKLNPVLSQNGRTAAGALVSGKDPLTTVGGRAALRNTILSDVASSLQSGQPPIQTLKLMGNPQGYAQVRRALTQTPEGARIFRAMERGFVQDVFNKTLTNGVIDWKKASNILRDPQLVEVLRQIGGDGLVTRFRYLQTMGNNLERNLDLYKKPEVISLFGRLVKETKSTGIMAAVMHALHMPMPVIAGLGLAKVGLKGATSVANSGINRLLMSERGFNLLNNVLSARTAEELSKQLPRLINHIEKEDDKK